MESLRDIRQNIKAIKSTQQIMQTMKMISSARIRKAQDAMTAARPFAQKMLQMVDDLKTDILTMSDDGDTAESWSSRFFVNKTGNPQKIGYTPDFTLETAIADYVSILEGKTN